MKFVLLLTLLGSGYGGIHSSIVPALTKLEFPDESQCKAAKEAVIRDWQEAGIISESVFIIPGWKKSDEKKVVKRNYSAICLPAMK